MPAQLSSVTESEHPTATDVQPVLTVVLFVRSRTMGRLGTDVHQRLAALHASRSFTNPDVPLHSSAYDSGCPRRSGLQRQPPRLPAPSTRRAGLPLRMRSPLTSSVYQSVPPISWTFGMADAIRMPLYVGYLRDDYVLAWRPHQSTSDSPPRSGALHGALA